MADAAAGPSTPIRQTRRRGGYNKNRDSAKRRVLAVAEAGGDWKAVAIANGMFVSIIQLVLQWKMSASNLTSFSQTKIKLSQIKSKLSQI
jgi:hypothetical protein